MRLRDYQSRGFRRVLEEFDAGIKSTLIVMATGTGKTVLFGAIAAHVIEEQAGRVLVLAHRGELLTQAANQLGQWGIDVAIEKADQKARASLWGEPSCVAASVQTMRGKRLQAWPRDHFSLVITDECHHAPAESYAGIYRHFVARHLGVTATADRLDGENLGQVYQTVAFEYSLREAIVDGNLSRLKVVRCETSVDLSSIRTTGGDLNQGDIEEAIRPHIEELVNATRQEIGDRPAIVFTPDVGSAEAFASGLRSVGIDAEAISGESKDRARILDDFHHRRFQVLCNCALLTEGFDAPFVSAIVLARPTKSRSLFAQMVGRGTRLYGGKEDCLVIDFAWKQLTGKHRLVSPVELFDTTGTDAESQEIACALVEDGDESDLLAAIEKGEELHRERQKFSIKARERAAVYRKVVYDPMSVFDVLGTPLRDETPRAQAEKPSAKQIETLRRFKVDNPEAMSRRRASMMLDELIGRARDGLATHKQIAHLVANGYEPGEVRAMKIGEASAILDQMFGNRHRA